MNLGGLKERVAKIKMPFQYDYIIPPPDDGGETYTKEQFLSIQDQIIKSIQPGCEIIDPFTGHFKKDENGELIICNRNDYDRDRWKT